jgi:Flp pilus assembly CpaE family ATPase
LDALQTLFGLVGFCQKHDPEKRRAVFLFLDSSLPSVKKKTELLQELRRFKLENEDEKTFLKRMQSEWIRERKLLMMPSNTEIDDKTTIIREIRCLAENLAQLQTFMYGNQVPPGIKQVSNLARRSTNLRNKLKNLRKRYESLCILFCSNEKSMLV